MHRDEADEIVAADADEYDHIVGEPDRIDALSYVNTLQNPIVFYASYGEPTGSRTAVLDDTRIPFDMAALEGVVVNGEWCWNGEGEPTDHNRNTVTLVKIYNDAAEWQKQCDDYDASAS